MIVENHKRKNQEVHFIDGTSVSIAQGESLEIDTKKCYAFEIDRISSCFKIKKKTVKPVDPKIESKKKKDDNSSPFGGDN